MIKVFKGFLSNIRVTASAENGYVVEFVALDARRLMMAGNNHTRQFKIRNYTDAVSEILKTYSKLCSASVDATSENMDNGLIWQNGSDYDFITRELIGTGNEALVTGVKLLGHLDSPREVDGELARRVMDSMEDLIAVTMENNTRDREMEDLVNLVADKAKELSQILGRKVTPQELADEGDVTLDQIREALRLTGDGIESLDS